MKRHVRKRKAAVFVCVLGICLLTSACVAQQEAGTKKVDSFSALPPAEQPALEEPASAELPADQRFSDGKLEWREDGSVALTLWTARAVFPHPVNFAFFCRLFRMVCRRLRPVQRHTHTVFPRENIQPISFG